MQNDMTKKEYNQIHAWIRSNFGKPLICENRQCENTSKTIYDWANISGHYLKIRPDWVRLCRKCHTFFDKKHGENRYNAKLNNAFIANIMLALKAGRTQVSIARDYGVSQPLISMVKNSLIWSHIKKQYD